jgi:hypothetical protein
MIKLFEKFTDISDTKYEILESAISTDNVDIIKFFISKGYDINEPGIILEAAFYDNVFRFFLESGVDIENITKANDKYTLSEALKNIVVQKALLDYGHEHIIFDTVGFNYGLKRIQKYADIIERFEDMSKYNL